MKRILPRAGALTIVLGLLAIWTGVPTARAAAIVVTSVADNEVPDGRCTLREAITNANDNAATFSDCAAGSGADAISFRVTGTITLGSALPEITGNLTVNGPGAASLAISGGGNYRVFNIQGNVIISGLTIRNGSNSIGGGIYNTNVGTLTVNNCIFSGNVASGGGGIFSEGLLTVNASAFSGNTADTGGGIAAYTGTMTVSNSTFSGNAAGVGGGIITSEGETALVQNTAFSGNTADQMGGGLHNEGMLIVRNSTFSNNIARDGDGGAIHSYGTLTISDSTFANNRGSRWGGAIANHGTLTATGALFQGNSTGAIGAAIEGGYGSVSSSCFVNNNDPAGVFDVGWTPGSSLAADNNWWNVPTGPNTGGETTNIPVTSFLTSRPACGAGAASAAPCADGRLNCRFGDDYAIIYNAQDDHGHPSLHTYCVNAAGKGILSMIVTSHDLEGIPPEPATNTLVKTADTKVCRAPVSLWVLTTGEYQMNIGPDYKGDLIRMIFNGLPPGERYFKKCNMFTSLEWCSQ